MISQSEMRIRRCQIKNFLNFSDPGFEIDFSDHPIQLLVGPNGAGKSNLVEILNHVFSKEVLRPARVHTSLFSDLERIATGNFSQVVQPSPQQLPPLKTWGREADTALVEADVDLTEGDYENFRIILANHDALSSVVTEFSGHNLPTVKGLDSELLAIKKVRFLFVLEPKEPRIKIQDPAVLDPSSVHPQLIRFLGFYFEYFHVIRACAVIAEDRDGRLAGVGGALKTPFAVLSAHRNVATLSTRYAVGNTPLDELFQFTAERTLGRTMRSAESESVAFEQFKRAVGLDYMKLTKQLGEVAAIAQIESGPRMAALNLALQRVGFQLRLEAVSQYTVEINFYLLNSSGLRSNFDGLSSGQKEAIVLLLTLYSDDFTGGQVIIDEPEIHLHPQLQLFVAESMYEVAKANRVQCIAVTHSPQFVNEKTIASTLGFATALNAAPRAVSLSSVKSVPIPRLARMLTLTRSATVLFADVVVVVEGESDRLLFTRLFAEWLGNRSDTMQQPRLEFLAVGGKKEVRTWKELLNEMGIPAFGIVDLDYVKSAIDKTVLEGLVDDGAASKRVLERLRAKRSADASSLLALLKRVGDGDCEDISDEAIALRAHLIKQHYKFGDIVQRLKSDHPREWAKVEGEVAKLRDENIFVLSRGELEDFIPTSKSVEKMVEFCASDEFTAWYARGDVAQQELVQILETIAGRFTKFTPPVGYADAPT